VAVSVIDIPKDFLNRELFQGWTTKGLKILTAYWKESFESGLRDPESSTFDDEFSVTSIFSTHSDFIHDLAWQKLCQNWNPTTVAYNAYQFLFVMKLFLYIMPCI